MMQAAVQSSEHPVSAVIRLRAARQTLWFRELWGSVPGVVPSAAIPHEEVDRLLSDPADIAEPQHRFYAENPDAVALTAAIDGAEQALSADARWQRLRRACSLSDAEAQFFSLAAAVALDPALGRVYAYLHDQPEMIHPTPWLAAALYDPGAEPVIVSHDSGLRAWSLLRRVPDGTGTPAAWQGWSADPGITEWLANGGDRDLPHGVNLAPGRSFAQLPVLYRDALEVAREFIQALEGNAPAIEIEIVGPEGSGRRTLAGQAADRHNRDLLAVNEARLLDGAAEAEIPVRVLEAVRGARLRDALLFWREGRDPSPLARRVLRETRGIRVVGRTSVLAEPAPADTAFRSIEVPPLDRNTREQLWSIVANCPAPRQVRDWLLTPGEIVQLSRVAAAGDEAIAQACRRPADSLNLLVRLPLPFEDGDLVLAEAVASQLRDFERQVRLRWDVYEQWGFDRLCPNGRGLVALFAGPSGTGKTMAAQVLAARLGLELYRLDPAQVVNKYIGETEKRLKIVFDECDRAHFLLLIDECEGMFGERFASKDAHDRYANLEIDYLLQRLERFQGVAILATNRKGDLDAAFLRRLRFVIDFLPPGPAERVRIWQSALPERSPSGDELLDSVDWSALAERVPLSGAEIKLAALNAAFLACATSRKKIGMPHILTAVRRELAKRGQTLRGFE